MLPRISLSPPGAWRADGTGGVARLRIGSVAVLGAGLLLTSCAPAAPVGPEPGAVAGTVVVFAAASLTEAFTALGEQFEADHPGTSVTVNFGSSSALAQQLTAGAPADVFAAASPSAMGVVDEAGLVRGGATVFASNSLRIAVPAGNPAGVTGLADFARGDLTVALCAPEVPCGVLSAQVFADAGITPAPDTLEQDVKATLVKVERDEVDCALVYRTDVLAAGGAVDGIDFPGADEAVTEYPIAMLSDAPNPAAARAFRDFVLSDTGTAALAAAGFGAG
ncbi:molybdate ABC transporter substrate-binding protein [Cryobacterium tagatosivorans]|uniref:Molybdate ABC transporter substrate-binding protein n=1 Tax=Cryobacterium tagatosivorans TaxID=1259199 RepID=A0A4R8UKD7_9MICO|nr:molybdate ABC transporter substrate-binding protein [Cryobacterium tagatosivorans]TFB57215.1 molybdate ABC transporter substrate-binding protein [Cryobacterium tagatosivorans]